MNRRTFLASLVAIPAGVVAAVKIAAREPELNAIEMGMFARGEMPWLAPRTRFFGPYSYEPPYIFSDQKTAKAIQDSFDRYYEKKYGYHASREAEVNNQRWVDYLNNRRGQELYAGMQTLTG